MYHTVYACLQGACETAAETDALTKLQASVKRSGSQAPSHDTQRLMAEDSGSSSDWRTRVESCSSSSASPSFFAFPSVVEQRLAEGERGAARPLTALERALQSHEA